MGWAQPSQPEPPTGPNQWPGWAKQHACANSRWCNYLENEAKREEKDCLPDLLEAMKTTVKLMLVYVFSACVCPFAFLVFLSEFIPLSPPRILSVFGLSLAVSPLTRRLLSLCSLFSFS
jgi:hypothetical protein